MLKFSNGTLRFYIFFALFSGILIYSLTLSKIFVIIITVFLGILKFPYIVVKNVFINVSKKFKKISINKSNKNQKLIKEK